MDYIYIYILYIYIGGLYGDYMGIIWDNMGVSENSVPPNPIVNDHYPY